MEKCATRMGVALVLSVTASVSHAQTPKGVAAPDTKISSLSHLDEVNGKTCTGYYAVVDKNRIVGKPDTGKVKLTFRDATVHVEIFSDHNGHGDRGTVPVVGSGASYEFESPRGLNNPGVTKWTMTFTGSSKISLSGSSTHSDNPIEVPQGINCH